MITGEQFQITIKIYLKANHGGLPAIPVLSMQRHEDCPKYRLHTKMRSHLQPQNANDYPLRNSELYPWVKC